MRILFDCRYTRVGRHDGISRYSARLVEELAKLHPVTMIIFDEQQLTMLPDLPWVKMPSPRAASEPAAALYVNKFEPDIVFTPMQTMGPWGRKFALVTVIHDLIYYTHRTPPRNMAWPVRLIWRGYHLWWGFQRGLLKEADAHLADSETTKALMERNRATPNPVTVVPLGVDLPATIPDRAAPEGERELVYMGSFMEYKNVDLLARALHELPGYRLRLMSRITGAERAHLSSLAPAGTIDFLDGATDDEYADALQRATALVTASRDEGFGLPIVEAMAVGTPVVISDIPIFREVGGPPALRFDQESVASFVAAVRSLEDDDEWMRRSTASAHFARRYSWAAAAQALLDVLTETYERWSDKTSKRVRVK
ncbi:MAG TPA: glycosyltransferase family 1 protein [Pseudolysinimonas sp.]|nr:glycosyltransferase family 1 protein [Pseudolysinimonas sp.]